MDTQGAPGKFIILLEEWNTFRRAYHAYGHSAAVDKLDKATNQSSAIAGVHDILDFVHHK